MHALVESVHYCVLQQVLGREQHLLRALQHLLDHEQVDTLPHRNCPLPLQRHPNTPHLLKLVINHLQLA